MGRIQYTKNGALCRMWQFEAVNVSSVGNNIATSSNVLKYTIRTGHPCGDDDTSIQRGIFLCRGNATRSRLIEELDVEACIGKSLELMLGRVAGSGDSVSSITSPKMACTVNFTPVPEQWKTGGGRNRSAYVNAQDMFLVRTGNMCPSINNDHGIINYVLTWMSHPPTDFADASSSTTKSLANTSPPSPSSDHIPLTLKIIGPVPTPPEPIISVPPPPQPVHHQMQKRQPDLVMTTSSPQQQQDLSVPTTTTSTPSCPVLTTLPPLPPAYTPPKPNQTLPTKPPIPTLPALPTLPTLPPQPIDSSAATKSSTPPQTSNSSYSTTSTPQYSSRYFNVNWM